MYNENKFDNILFVDNILCRIFSFGTRGLMSDISLHQSKKISLHKDIFMRNHVNELVNEVKSHIENGISEIINGLLSLVHLIKHTALKIDFVCSDKISYNPEYLIINHSN